MIGKRFREKTDEQIIGKVGYQRYEVNAFAKEYEKLMMKVRRVKVLKLHSITKYKIYQ